MGIGNPRRVVRLTLAASVLAVSACASNEESPDYSVSGKAEQLIPAGDAAIVVVRCYCPRHEILGARQDGFVDVQAQGTKSSEGYHGTQATPTSVPVEALRFVVNRQGKEMVLESRESTYIHHALILDHVSVAAPTNVSVRFEVIGWDALEGRSVGNER
jgi:hypothetical protein